MKQKWGCLQLQIQFHSMVSVLHRTQRVQLVHTFVVLHVYVCSTSFNIASFQCNKERWLSIIKCLTFNQTLISQNRKCCYQSSSHQSPSGWFYIYKSVIKSVVVNILICSTIKLFRLLNKINTSKGMNTSTAAHSWSLIFKIYNLHNKKPKHPMIVSTTLLRKSKEIGDQ